MIHLEEKKDCCGCSACVNRCPIKCILVCEDVEGFLYPVIDKDACVDCGLCEKVCPILQQREKRDPLHVYAAKNKDESIRMESSSGGVFTLLAELILNEGGVVFGAKFNERWNLIHDYTETVEGLSDFRGSKYIQSNIGNAYICAEAFLKKGRKVLFSGTPCQISGFKLFLRKEYENLLTVDFICHGVPSPGVFNRYLDEVIKNSVPNVQNTLNKENAISGIQFRNKRLGWNKYSLLLKIKIGKENKTICESFDRNLFLRGFLKDLYLRPSCYACPTKSFKSSSDITIGDFWGIENVLPDFYDDQGVSAVMILSEKGKSAYSNLLLDSISVSYSDVLKSNTSIVLDPVMPQKRSDFFQNYSKKSLHLLISDLSRTSIAVKIKRKLINVLKAIGLFSVIKSLLKE